MRPTRLLVIDNASNCALTARGVSTATANVEPGMMARTWTFGSRHVPGAARRALCAGSPSDETGKAGFVPLT